MKKSAIKIFSAIALVIAALVTFAACSRDPEVYNLTYVVDGAEHLKVEVSANGKLDNIPTAPDKDGYTFDGWYFDNDVFTKKLTETSFEESPLTEDTTVYAKYTKIEPTEPDPVTLTEISVKPGTVASEITLGDSFDFSTLVIVLKYSDNTTAELPFAPGCGIGVDVPTLNEAREYEAKFSYQGKTCTHKLTVVEPVPDVRYLTFIIDGEEFTKVEIASDGSFGEIPSAPLKADHDFIGWYFDEGTWSQRLNKNSFAGAAPETDATVYAKYVEAEPVPVTLARISVKSGTLTNEIKVGESVDTSALVIILHFSDNTSEELAYTTESGITVTLPTAASAGEFDVEISYQSKKCTHKLTIVDFITEISFVSASFRTVYKPGAALDAKADIQATVKYKSGNQAKIDVTRGLVVGGYDELSTAAPGSHNLTLTYEEGGVTLSTTVSVTVIGITELKIDGVPTALELGDTLDLSALSVTVTYGDSSEGVFTGASLKINSSDAASVDSVKITHNIDTEVADTYALTAEYLGITKSVEVKVSAPGIESITISGTPEGLIVGDTLDLTALTVTVTLEGGDVLTFTGDALVINEELGDKNPLEFVKITHAIDTETVGEYALTAEYLGARATATISVDPEVPVQKVVGISLNTDSVKKNFKIGEAIDVTGLVIVVHYNFGEDTEFAYAAGSDATLILPSNAAPGRFEVKITYLEKTASYEITIEDELLSMAFVEGSFKTVYLPTEALESSDNIAVLLSYKSGRSLTVYATDAALTVSGYDAINTSKLGTYTLALTYTKDGVTLNTSVEVSVLTPAKIEISGIKTSVRQGKSFKLDDAIITVSYANGEVREYTYRDLIINGNEVTAGAGVITVTHDVNVKVKDTYTLSAEYFGAKANLYITVTSATALPEVPV